MLKLHDETVFTGYVGTDGQIKLEKKISVFKKKKGYVWTVPKIRRRRDGDESVP